jgi:hypothetical protein
MAILQATSVTGTITATSFSGSGSSLTSLSTSQISTGSVTRAALPSGTVINTTHYADSTRISTPSQANYDAFSWTVNKQIASSRFHVMGVVPCFGETNAGNYFCITANGTRHFTGIIDKTDYVGYQVVIVNTYIDSGVNATGNMTFSWGWSSNDGSANRPTNIINQNNNEDGRNRQQGSQFIVWEIAA